MMCVSDKQIKLTQNDNGDLVVTIKTYDLWDSLTQEQQGEILENSAYWNVFERAAINKLTREYSSPTMDNVIHKLREVICTDSEIVGELAMEFFQTLIREVERQKTWRIEAEKRYQILRNNWGKDPTVDYSQLPGTPEISKSELNSLKAETLETIKSIFEGIKNAKA